MRLIFTIKIAICSGKPSIFESGPWRPAPWALRLPQLRLLAPQPVWLDARFVPFVTGDVLGYTDIPSDKLTIAMDNCPFTDDFNKHRGFP